jgi:uncharacterized membrane protein
MANEPADEIAELKRRIEAIENLLKIETSPAPGPSPDRQETDSVRDRVLNVALSPQAGAGKSFRAKRDIESYIGQRWLPVIGIVAIIFGVSFFLRYTFQTNLVGPAGRVSLGAVGGVVLIGLGGFWRSKYRNYSWVLSGGGIGLLYLSIFAALSYYQLVSRETALIFMVAVTLLCAILSLLQDAQALAGVAVLGGFLTPFLLSTGTDRHVELFAYVTLLNAGILLVVSVRKWRALSLAGLSGTIVTFSVWYIFYFSPRAAPPAELFLTLFFVEYLLATILGGVLPGKPATKIDLVLLTANAASFFGWSYAVLRADHYAVLGPLAALLSALYFGFAYQSFKKSWSPSLSLFFGGIGVVFVTLVFPIELSGDRVTVAWAVEAVVLTYTGVRFRSHELRVAALICLAVTVLHLALLDSEVHDLLAYTLILNQRFFSYLVTIVSAVLISRLYTDRSGEGKPERSTKESAVPTFLGILWNLLLLAILSLEASAYFARSIAEAGLNASEPASTHKAAYDTLVHERNTSLSVLWAGYAIVLLAIGTLRKDKRARIGGLVLFALTLAKVFLVDMANLPSSYRFVSFMVVGMFLLAGSYLYYRSQSRIS